MGSGVNSMALIQPLFSGGCFLFIWWFLNNGPLKILFTQHEKREAETTGAQDNANLINLSSESIEAEVALELNNERRNLSSEREILMKRAKLEADKIIVSAESDAAVITLAGREKILNQKLSAEKDISITVEKVAMALMNQVAGSSVSNMLH